MKWTDHPPGICRWGVRIVLKGIRHKEVCILRIGLMYVYYSMYFYYLLLFVIHMLSLDKACGSAHVSQPECDVLYLS